MTVDFNLSAFFVGIYNKNKSSLDFLIESAVPKDVMKKVYETLIKDGLVPIEKLPDEQKKELVKECRETGLTFTNQTLIEAAMILHTIKTISET